MSKMNIDKAFKVACKRMDDYDTFMLMVSHMREAQIVADRAMTESDDYSEALIYINKAEEIEKQVDKWLEENK